MVVQAIESHHFTVIENSRNGPCLTRIPSVCYERTTPVCRLCKHFVLNEFVAKMNEMNVTAFGVHELCNFEESFVCWKENFVLF